MFRLIKWFILLSIIAGTALWVTGYKVQGKTIQEHLKPYMESPLIKEGIKDIRSLLGEGLKSAGEMITEDVTDSERKQLDDVLKKEMKEGKPIQGVANQKALPPVTPPSAAPQTRPDLSKKIDEMKATQKTK